MFMRQRKINALGLLLLVALPLLFSATLMLKQKVIQLHRGIRFERETLETILLPADKLHWIKPGKELLVDGRLFDVKSFTIKNGKTSLTGFFDGEEDEVVTQIRDITEQKKESNNPFTRLAVKLSFMPVYTEGAPVSFQNSWHIIARDLCSSYSEIISQGFHPLDIPPPKYC